MSIVNCPICRKPFERETSETFPFCCARCKQIDLGRWLGEKYSVPIERTDEDEPDEIVPSDADQGE